MDGYVISDYEYRALIALRDFAENAFCGYPEGRGRKEEMLVADTFAWIVRDYIGLLEASKETVEEYMELRQ